MNRVALNLIALILFLCVSPWAHAQVWINYNSWSPEWEKAYSAWVARNWTIDIFDRATLIDGTPNPYAGLKADCADTVYAMRAIFSYENNLPFAINDATGGSAFISNDMHRWDGIRSETERFRKFLGFLFNVVSTQSLPFDTYPVAISRRTVHAGGIIATTHTNHHSWTIKTILPIGVPHLIFNSSIGRTSGSLLQERQSWPNPVWVFEDNFTPSGHAGLRYWRSMYELKIPEWQVTGYSEEQFRIPLKSWTRTVQNKLALIKESDEAQLKRLMKNACVELKARVPAVKEAADFLKSQPQQCLSAQDYDTYSTPNRDHRFFDALIALREAYSHIQKQKLQADPYDGTSEDQRSDTIIYKQMRRMFPAIERSHGEERHMMASPLSQSDSTDICRVEYARGKFIGLIEAKRRMFLGQMSNNPNDPFEVRWGERVGPSELARSCPAWGVWTPEF